MFSNDKWFSCRLRTVKDQHHLESHPLDIHYDSIKVGSKHNEPDAVYCTAADTVSAVEQELPSDHSIKTIDCVAYGTNEPKDSNESDIRNSEIYESIS